MGRLRKVFQLFVIALISIPASVADGGAAEINCHERPGTGCVVIGPHPLPLSVPEFNRLANDIGATPEGGAALLLHALLNAGEAPDLAAELAGLRLRDAKGVAGEALRGFIAADPGLAARCAASFVAGTKAPDFGYRSTAVALPIRRVATGGAAAASAAACSGALGCVPLRLSRDPERGWVVETADPLIAACRRLGR